MQMQAGNVGIAGEVRCVITRTDGSVKTDTGYQKNLILNQGLDFFGGGHGSSLNASCAIGSGNSAPAVTQTGLDAFVALASGTDTTSDYSYVDKSDNLYRMWEQKKYRFTGLNNVNISEVGLVSDGKLSSDYYLTTRALIKDSLGAPTSISVKTGETLDIFYKIHRVVDISDNTFIVNVLDGDGADTGAAYNVIIRSQLVGTNKWGSVSEATKVSSRSGFLYSPLDISAFDSSLSGGVLVDSSATLKSYSPNSYKRILWCYFNLNDANATLRSLSTDFVLFPFQARIGRVSDDAPLTKTNKDTLLFAFEISWGRFEGEL